MKINYFHDSILLFYAVCKNNFLNINECLITLYIYKLLNLYYLRIIKRITQLLLRN
jgi:hypothetical protein